VCNQNQRILMAGCFDVDWFQQDEPKGSRLFFKNS